MTYHNKEKQEVLQELNVQEATGLSSSEVKKRREQYGENRLRAKNQRVIGRDLQSNLKM